MRQLFLFGMLAVPSLALADRSDWRELTLGKITIYSTLGDSATRDIARQFQAFEETLGVMLQNGERLPETPTRIYLLSDKDFNQYAALRAGLEGFFQQLEYGNVMVVDADKPFRLVRVGLFHEYVHYIQNSTTTISYPVWYVEGFAELFSGFELKGNKIRVGDLPYGVGINPIRWLPVERLLAVKKTDPEYQQEGLASEFYGESWLLVHMLLIDNADLLPRTLHYLSLMDARISEPEAFQAAFPFDKPTLDRMLHDLYRSNHVHVLAFSLSDPLVVDQAALTRLTTTQADAEFTRLVWQLKKPKAMVDGLVARLAAEQGADPAVRALIARIAASSGDPVAIGDLAASLAQGGADNPQERIDVAAALLNEKGDAATNRQALAVLDGLLRLDAPPIEAAQLWVAAASRTGIDPTRIIAVLEALQARAPNDTRVLRALGGAYEKAGDKPHARDAYNRIILVSHSLDERHWAQMQADSARLQDTPPQVAH